MTTKKIVLLIFLYSMLVLLHAFPFWGQKTADVIPDEISYLAQARFFAGNTTSIDLASFLQGYSYLAGKENLPETEGWPYYHFGYSLIVSPAYWLSDEPETTYQSVILINSILISSLFIIIFFWIMTLTKIEFSTAILIALITSLYPAYSFYVHIGWAENAFIPFFALSVLLYTKYLRDGGTYLLLLFALVVGFLYTIHPRGLAVSLGGLICLLALTFSRQGDRVMPIVGSLIVIGILYYTKVTTGQLSVLMNAKPHGGGFSEKLATVFDLNLFPVVIGHFFYLSLSTVGLFIMGVLFIFHQLIKSSDTGLRGFISNKTSGTFIYILLISLIMFAVSVLFFAKPEAVDKLNPSIDKYMYGRYNEGLLSVYISLGLLFMHKLFSLKDGIQQYAKLFNWFFSVFVVSALAYSWYLSDMQGMRAIHASGLFPWYFLTLNLEGWYGVIIVFVAPLLWSWILLQLYFKNVLKGMLASGLYFFLMSLSLIVYVTPQLRVFN